MLAKFGRRFLRVGDPIPKSKAVLVVKKDGKYEIDKDIELSELLQKKNAVIVGYPGAFTPVCTSRHLPGFIKIQQEFFDKDYDIYALSINDPWTVKAYAQQLGGDLKYVADAVGELTKEIEGGLDFGDHLGFRTRRFSIVIEDGKIKQINDEEGGELTDKATAENTIKKV